MKAPETIWLDPRVASRIPTSQADARARGAANIKPIGYMREDLVTARIIAASNADEELIIQIQTIDSTLYGLSSHGRLYARRSAADAWELDLDRELAP